MGAPSSRKGMERRSWFSGSRNLNVPASHWSMSLLPTLLEHQDKIQGALMVAQSFARRHPQRFLNQTLLGLQGIQPRSHERSYGSGNLLDGEPFLQNRRELRQRMEGKRKD